MAEVGVEGGQAGGAEGLVREEVGEEWGLRGAAAAAGGGHDCVIDVVSVGELGFPCLGWLVELGVSWRRWWWCCVALVTGGAVMIYWFEYLSGKKSLYLH